MPRMTGNIAQRGGVTLRKVGLNWRGMQVAAGILYSQVLSVMRRPVSESVMTSSLVKRPSPWMKAPSTCKRKPTAPALTAEQPCSASAR